MPRREETLSTFICLSMTLAGVLGTNLARNYSDSDTHPPVIELGPPPHKSYNAGQLVSLPCTASGSLNIAYTWTLNGGPLPADRSFRPESDGSLHIVKARVEHRGTYQCRASSHLGTALSNVTHLKLAELRRVSFHENIHHVKVSESTYLQIPCNHSHSVPVSRTRYRWYTVACHIRCHQPRNKRLLVLSRRVSVDQSGSLIFANVRREDELNGATYVCEVSNSLAGRSLEGSFTKISVDSGSDLSSQHGVIPSFIKSTSSPHVVLLGRPMKISCYLMGRPTPTVQWSKLYHNRFVGVSSHIISQHEHSVSIRRTQFSDAGIYRCQGTNSVGKSAHLKIQVVVHELPKFIFKPRSVNATNGTRVSFRCVGLGKPKPKIYWYLNGHLLSKSSLNGGKWSISTNFSQLSIERVTLLDTSSIQCKLSNIYGYKIASAYLNVKHNSRHEQLSESTVATISSSRTPMTKSRLSSHVRSTVTTLLPNFIPTVRPSILRNSGGLNVNINDENQLKPYGAKSNHGMRVQKNTKFYIMGAVFFIILVFFSTLAIYRCRKSRKKPSGVMTKQVILPDVVERAATNSSHSSLESGELSVTHSLTGSVHSQPTVISMNITVQSPLLTSQPRTQESSV